VCNSVLEEVVSDLHDIWGSIRYLAGDIPDNV
jgi:hypothetical protein